MTAVYKNRPSASRISVQRVPFGNFKYFSFFTTNHAFDSKDKAEYAG